MTLEKLRLVRDIFSGLLLVLKDKGIEAKICITENALGEPEIVIRDLKKKGGDNYVGKK